MHCASSTSAPGTPACASMATDRVEATTEAPGQAPTTSSPAGRQASPSTGRLVFLDGIRALAALAVVFNHGYQTVTADGGLRRHVFFLGYGNFAVAVFIVVSGYSLALGASRRGRTQRFWTFVRRRAWRIVPPYVAALVLSTVLILTVIGSPTGTPWDMVLPLSWSGVAVNALLLQDVVVARAPNHVFWSIAVEWHLYFLFPLLLALRRRTPRSFLLAVGALGCGLLWLGYGGKPYVGFPPQFFGLFVLGVVAGDLVTDESRRARALRSRFRPRWTVVAISVAAPLGVLLVQVDRSFFAAELVLGGAVAAFILALTVSPIEHPVRRFLEWPPLAWVGLFSYSLYLTHAPALQILWQYIVRPLQLGANAELAATLFGATVTSLPVALVFHVLFERPFMNHRSVRAMVARFRRLSEDEAPGPLTQARAERTFSPKPPDRAGGVGLGDPDPRVRARAVEMLPGLLGAAGEKALPAAVTDGASTLARDLGAADPGVRLRAVEALSACLTPVP